MPSKQVTLHLHEPTCTREVAWTRNTYSPASLLRAFPGQPVSKNPRDPDAPHSIIKIAGWTWGDFYARCTPCGVFRWLGIAVDPSGLQRHAQQRWLRVQPWLGTYRRATAWGAIFVEGELAAVTCSSGREVEDDACFIVCDPARLAFACSPRHGNRERKLRSAFGDFYTPIHTPAEIVGMCSLNWHHIDDPAASFPFC